jgi:hypothetical protein
MIYPIFGIGKNAQNVQGKQIKNILQKIKEAGTKLTEVCTWM